jgi:hypothetical protein
VNAPGQNPFVVVFGGVVLAEVIPYYGFMAINGMGLADLQAVGTVLGKKHRVAGSTYSTQIVGYRTLVVPQTMPESVRSQYRR